MDARLLNIAADMVRAGEALTMEALARRAGISRSTAHRRTGGRKALVEALASSGVEAGARALLLSATREAVAARGLVGVSVGSLAERAGTSPMTVYRLFGDRESLLREALADVFPSRAFQEMGRDGADLEDTLLAVAAGMVRFAGTYPGLMALMLVPASADQAELMRLHGLQEDLRTRLLALLERHAADGTIPPGDALERAGAFSGLCLGASLLLSGLRPLQEADVEPRARGVVRAFLAAL